MEEVTHGIEEEEEILLHLHDQVEGEEEDELILLGSSEYQLVGIR